MKINAHIKGTYNKTREFEIIDILPEIGDVVTIDDPNDAEIIGICEINDSVQEDERVNRTFYRITTKRKDDGCTFDDYVVINRKEHYISLDNGASFLTADEAFTEMDRIHDQYGYSVEGQWNSIVDMMDADTMNAVEDTHAASTRLGFLKRYLELAEDDLIIP